MAEGQKQYTFMLLRFKTSTQTRNILQQKSKNRTTEQTAMKPYATALVLFGFVANSVAHCTDKTRTAKSFVLLEICIVCTDVRKII